MRPALTPASKLVLDLPTPDGWNAELTWATRQCTGRDSNSRSFDHQSDALPLHYRVNPVINMPILAMHFYDKFSFNIAQHGSKALNDYGSFLSCELRRHVITGWPKKIGTHFSVLLNLTKY